IVSFSIWQKLMAISTASAVFSAALSSCRCSAARLVLLMVPLKSKCRPPAYRPIFCLLAKLGHLLSQAGQAHSCHGQECRPVDGLRGYAPPRRGGRQRLSARPRGRAAPAPPLPAAVWRARRDDGVDR